MRLVVVAVTLLLSDVTCQTVHNVSISHDLHSGRQRRQAETVNQNVVVDRHNALRALEGAANMQLMVWSSKLASNAQPGPNIANFDMAALDLDRILLGVEIRKILLKK